MKTRPWYRRFPDNFIAGTARLTLEEKGAYSLVLDLIYARGGPIADEPRYIAGICNCSTRKWVAIRQRLIDLGKLVAKDGSLWNERALDELGDTAKAAEVLSTNGRLGGRKSAEKRANGPRKAAEMQSQAWNINDLGQAPLKHDNMQETRTPIVPVPGTVSRASKKGSYGDLQDPAFSDFQSNIWPKRWHRANNTPERAFRAYSKLSDADRASCRQWLAKNSKAFLDADEKFRPMLSTWINSRGWEADGAAQGTATSPTEDWSKRLSRFRENDLWAVGWGPKPGEPGCRVPVELLRNAGEAA